MSVMKKTTLFRQSKSNSISDIAALTTEAYRAIRQVKKRPVDIIVGTKSRFENRRVIPSVENEVYEKGVLLYGSGSDTVDEVS